MKRPTPQELQQRFDRACGELGDFVWQLGERHQLDDVDLVAVLEFQLKVLHTPVKVGPLFFEEEEVPA
jgi:hypothetical protein